GADSTALLHAICAIRDQLRGPVTAIHINHGLHGDASGWQTRCEQFCKHYRVPLVSQEIEPVANSGQGLEAEARRLRYEAIASQLGPGAGLLTAHHADDQAETLLLNLMRGSGVDGLAAMPNSRPFGEGLLQRPLLEFQGNALRRYLDENKVEWIEDPSNQQVEHDRNFIRHEIIPLLERRWPAVSQRLLLTCGAMRSARRLLEGLADDYLAANLVHPQVLQITADAGSNSELFKLAVRRWIRNSDLPSIPAYRLESLFEQTHTAGEDRQVSVEWDVCALRCYRQQLWLLPRGDIEPCPARQWPEDKQQLDLDDIGRLVLSGGLSGKLPGNLMVDKRSSLEKDVILQGGRHKALKNIFQACGIPAWLRDSIPVISHAGEVVAVGDLFFSDRFANLLSGHGITLNWRPRNALLQYIQAQQNQR
ncbi:MAG: tRNA lysidine(34) synthetase TilS, partial [Xanthomonadales bacterium]|nr:tRNA lysidine(34) synthetase TilS [Xanthomonadales bacterium]